MIPIYVQYYGYDVSEYRQQGPNGRVRWQDLAGAANLFSKWSQWRECRVDPTLSQLCTWGYEVSSKLGPNCDAQRMLNGSYYIQHDRHFQLMAAMMHQLSQLSFISDLRFHEYDTLFYRRRDFKQPFIDTSIAFAPLRTVLWPDNPFVPPFVVSDSELVYSPVQFSGLTRMGIYELDRHPFRMTILDNFAAIGGWHAMKPRLHVEPTAKVS